MDFTNTLIEYLYCDVRQAYFLARAATTTPLPTQVRQRTIERASIAKARPARCQRYMDDRALSARRCDSMTSQGSAKDTVPHECPCVSSSHEPLCLGAIQHRAGITIRTLLSFPGCVITGQAVQPSEKGNENPSPRTACGAELALCYCDVSASVIG